MGGDEFTVTISKNTDTELVKQIASKIIEEIDKPYPAVNDKIGASIGIAFYPRCAKTPKELLAKADEAMYKAKANGKNQYFFYGEG